MKLAILSACTALLAAAPSCSTAIGEPTKGSADGSGSTPSPKLAITGLEPNKGDPDGGTYVRVQGTQFIGGGKQPRSLKIYFGSRQGTVVRFVSDTEIIVQAPAGKVGTTVDVLGVFEPGGEVKLKQAFTYTGPKP